MVDYYRRVSAGMGRSQALREAQLAMLKGPEPRASILLGRVRGDRGWRTLLPLTPPMLVLNEVRRPWPRESVPLSSDSNLDCEMVSQRSARGISAHSQLQTRIPFLSVLRHSSAFSSAMEPGGSELLPSSLRSLPSGAVRPRPRSSTACGRPWTSRTTPGMAVLGLAIPSTSTGRSESGPAGRSRTARTLNAPARTSLR